MKKYFDNFADYESIVNGFMNGEYDYETGKYKKIQLPKGFPKKSDILFAAYGTEESYSGSAIVVFSNRDGQLFIVEGGHCSCNGLEGQWVPTKTTIKALAMMDLSSAYTTETREDWNSFIKKYSNG